MNEMPQSTHFYKRLYKFILKKKDIGSLKGIDPTLLDCTALYKYEKKDKEVITPTKYSVVNNPGLLCAKHLHHLAVEMKSFYEHPDEHRRIAVVKY